MSLTGEYAKAVGLGRYWRCRLFVAAKAQEKPVDIAQVQAPPAATATPSSVVSPAPSIDDDPNWHFTSLSYLWFPGVSGTVGAKGYTTRVAVSPSDLVKHFNIGLMGSFEPQYKRWSFPHRFCLGQAFR